MPNSRKKPGWNKMLKSFLLFVSVLTAAILSGCGGNLIKLYEVDNGKTIPCSTGDTIEIRLPGNPSTGYTWQTGRMANDEILVLTEKTFEQVEAPGRNLVGVPGTYIFRYEVTGRGSEGIQLHYLRTWENLPPSGIYEVLVQAE